MLDQCPAWADWLDDRHVAVKCRQCWVIYTEKYEFTEFYDQGRKSRTKIVGGVPKNCKVCRENAAEEKRKALPVDHALVEAVKRYARDNYEIGGWDYVVETYMDLEIWGVIAGAKNPDQAIARMAKVVRLMAERRRDVESTVW
jgi:hypothetical protein